MPSILYHDLFGEKVFRLIGNKLKVNKVDFLSGNLIPDFVVGDNKDQSHYRIPASVKGFKVPDMEKVKKDWYDPKDSVKLGIYAHFYYDHHYIEDFLIPEFIWDEEKNIVINPRTGKSWSGKEFFAKPSGVLYNGYTQINKKMLADGHIDMETINMIPDELPMTGNPIFDTRRKKTWREELEGYLAEDAPYTGEALDYQRLCDATDRIAVKFVEEEL